MRSRIHEQVRTRQQWAEPFIVDVLQEHEIVAYAEPVSGGEDFFCAVPGAAGADQLVWYPCLSLQSLKRCEQAKVVHPGVFESPRVKDVWRMQVKVVGHFLPGLTPWHGCQPGQIRSVVNHVNAIATQIDLTDQLTAQRATG